MKNMCEAINDLVESVVDADAHKRKAAIKKLREKYKDVNRDKIKNYCFISNFSRFIQMGSGMGQNKTAQEQMQYMFALVDTLIDETLFEVERIKPNYHAIVDIGSIKYSIPVHDTSEKPVRRKKKVGGKK